MLFFFFFFNDTATTEIYTLSLHDALPISRVGNAFLGWLAHSSCRTTSGKAFCGEGPPGGRDPQRCERSEEHTSELQSLAYLVCRLLLEKKKKTKIDITRYQTKQRQH